MRPVLHRKASWSGTGRLRCLPRLNLPHCLLTLPRLTRSTPPSTPASAEEGQDETGEEKPEEPEGQGNEVEPEGQGETVEHSEQGEMGEKSEPEIPEQEPQ